MLIGPLGAGKTLIGSLLSEITGFILLDTDNIFKKYRIQKVENFDRLGYQDIRKTLDECLKVRNQIIIESTGASKYFFDFYNRIKSRYNIYLVSISASLEAVKAIVKLRNKNRKERHEDGFVEEVYCKTSLLPFQYDYHIENECLSKNQLYLILSEMKEKIHNVSNRF